MGWWGGGGGGGGGLGGGGGGVAYADDIAILAPSLHGRDEMVEICEEYAVEYDIKCNGQKSKFMTFTGRDCHKVTGNVTICGDVIQCHR